MSEEGRTALLATARGLLSTCPGEAAPVRVDKTAWEGGNMRNVTRRSFVAMAGLGALGLVGCSEDAKVSKGLGDPVSNGANSTGAGDYVEFSGLRIDVPDGWSPSDMDGSLALSSGTGMVVIQPGIEYSADEESMANSIAAGATESDDMVLTGQMTKGLLNGTLCYSAPYMYESNDMSYTGEIRAIFSDGLCWSVLCGDWGESDGETSLMVADTIAVI